MPIGSWLPIGSVLLGGGGLAWILKFQREDAGRAVEQVNKAMEVMHGLNNDLIAGLARVARERDDEIVRHRECVERVRLLNVRVGELERILYHNGII